MTCRFCVSLCCSAHYRSPLNFSAELMEAAKNGLERIRTAASDLQFLADLDAEAEGIAETGRGGKTWQKQRSYVDKFEAAMEDDFNTADADLCYFRAGKTMPTQTCRRIFLPRHMLPALLDELKTLCDVLGIIVETKEEMLDC